MTAHHIPATSPKGGAALPQAQRKPRVSAKVRRAVDLIANDGLTQVEAARRASLHPVTLCRALKRPQVAALLDEAKALAALEADNLKGIARSLAIRTGIDLMRSSQSDQVKAKMVEFFAGEGRQPLVNIQLPAADEPASGYAYRRPQTIGPDHASVVEDAQVVDPKEKDDEA